MNDIKKHLQNWSKLIDEYNRDAIEIQKQITEVLKTQWTTKSNSLISKAEMKRILDRTGILLFITKF